MAGKPFTTVVVALLLACALPLDAARVLHSRPAKPTPKVSRSLLHLRSWSPPPVQSGIRLGWESGPTTQEQTAMDSISQRLAQVQGEAAAAGDNHRMLLSSQDYAMLHPTLAHGKNMAFETGGPMLQEQATMDAIDKHVETGEVDNMRGDGARKLLSSQDYAMLHPTLAHSKKMAFETGGPMLQEQATMDAIDKHMEAAEASGSDRMLLSSHHTSGVSSSHTSSSSSSGHYHQHQQQSPDVSTQELEAQATVNDRVSEVEGDAAVADNASRKLLAATSRMA